MSFFWNTMYFPTLSSAALRSCQPTFIDFPRGLSCAKLRPASPLILLLLVNSELCEREKRSTSIEVIKMKQHKGRRQNRKRRKFGTMNQLRLTPPPPPSDIWYIFELHTFLKNAAHSPSDRFQTFFNLMLADPPPPDRHLEWHICIVKG